MELKSYDKPWLPAFKGAFLIIFGIMAMLQIFGTVKSLGVLFIVLISMIGILLIATGIRFKNSKYRGWTIASGIINLGICIFLVLQVDKAKDIIEAREGVVSVILVWVLFYAISEIVEAVILYAGKNAFASLFLINALLSLLFGYSLYLLMGELDPEKIFNVGLIALVFGIVNELSAHLLSRINGKL